MTCGSSILGAAYRSAPPVAQRILGLSATNPDSDGDGLLDGLEDANGDLIRQEEDLEANWTDTDRDGLTDGLELRIWGASSICDIVPHLGATPFDTSSYRAVLPLATDPRVNDTDGDDVWDGNDLNPRGLAQFGIDLQTDTPVRNIDVSAFHCRTWRSYFPFWAPMKTAPELAITIVLETAAGPGTIHIPPLPELCAKRLEPARLSSVLARATLVTTGTLLGVMPTLDGGLLMIPLPHPSSARSPRSCGMASAS